VATPYYQDKHVKWRAKLRKFVDEELRPYADEWDEAGGLKLPVEELRKKIAAAGLLAPWAPAEWGGTPPEGGWDNFMNIIWTDEHSRCGSGGVSIVTVFITQMALPHTLEFGSDFLKQEVCIPVLREGKTICVALTEPSGGSDLANLKTTAVEAGEDYLISGEKKFITGGLNASWFSTLARTSGKGLQGLSLIMIPAASVGIDVKKIPTSGWWAGNTTLVTFNDVRVPKKYVIGEPGMGFAYMAQVMNGERLVACVGAIRGQRECLHGAISFARARKTFGKPLIKHQVIVHKIAHVARNVEAAQAQVEALAFAMDQGMDVQSIGGTMALLKVQCSQGLELAVREASQILGGASFVRGGKGHFIERMARDLRVACVGGGSEEVMTDLAMRIAKL
jgi:acyl-CoA dehydrogenase